MLSVFEIETEIEIEIWFLIGRFFYSPILCHSYLLYKEDLVFPTNKLKNSLWVDNYGF